MKMSIIRGIIVGGSLGIFAALFGFSDAMARTALTGSFAGALAGYTSYKLLQKRKEKKVDKE